MVIGADKTPRFAEFFCGGGMVRAGLGKHWECAFANDIDPMKCAVYRDNWNARMLHEGDIADVPVDPLLQPIDLYWASSPCQDFSLAGKGRGLDGVRSGVFKEWARLIKLAVERGQGPRIIAFENVVGLLTRNGGADLTAIVRILSDLGYRVGALEIDAARFLPQSRPRLFIVGIAEDQSVLGLTETLPTGPFHTAKIRAFHRRLPKALKQMWLWWRHEAPDIRRPSLNRIIDPAPDTAWLTEEGVSHLLSMMSDPSLSRVRKARESGKVEIGMLYKRGRPDGQGKSRQRAEVRFDGLAGCLRTPAGGSSRQTVMFVQGNETRARLLSSREVARLMGLGARYKMPERYNDAYRVAGDGVAVPIVSYLDQTLFQPLLQDQLRREVA